MSSNIEELLAEALRKVVREEVRAAFQDMRKVEAEDPEKLVGVAAAALRLGVSKSTIYKLSDKLELPSVKVGAGLRFKIADLDTYKETHRRSPALVAKVVSAAGRG